MCFGARQHWCGSLLEGCYLATAFDQKLSKKEGLSMSLIVRDLVREALTIYEDTYWAQEAEAREKTFSRAKAKSHKQIWRS